MTYCCTRRSFDGRHWRISLSVSLTLHFKSHSHLTPSFPPDTENSMFHLLIHCISRNSFPNTKPRSPAVFVKNTHTLKDACHTNFQRFSFFSNSHHHLQQKTITVFLHHAYMFNSRLVIDLNRVNGKNPVSAPRCSSDTLGCIVAPLSGCTGATDGSPMRHCSLDIALKQDVVTAASCFPRRGLKFPSSPVLPVQQGRCGTSLLTCMLESLLWLNQCAATHTEPVPSETLVPSALLSWSWKLKTPKRWFSAKCTCTKPRIFLYKLQKDHHL